MKAILAIGAMFVSVPALAQTQSGTQTASPSYVHPAPAAPNWVHPPTSPGQVSSNPWVSTPPVSPYKKMADEIRAASNPAQAPATKANCEEQKGKGCEGTEPPPKN